MDADRGAARGHRTAQLQIADRRWGHREATEGTEDTEYLGLIIGLGVLRGGFWNLLWARELSNVSL